MGGQKVTMRRKVLNRVCARTRCGRVEGVSLARWPASGLDLK